MKNIAFHNLGCKVNSYETEKMMKQMEDLGYTIVPFDQIADIYVVNTCTVTAIADKKSRQMLHRAKARNQDALVVAVGCYVSAKQTDAQKDPALDLTINNEQKEKFAEILLSYVKEKENQTQHQNPDQTSRVVSEPQDTNDKSGAISKKPDTDEALRTDSAQQDTDEKSKTALEQQNANDKSEIASEQQGINDIRRDYLQRKNNSPTTHTRAYVKIQDGCNQFCSYCIIPYVRGRARSRDEHEILTEIATLTNAGAKEIVLTGIHITSYQGNAPHKSDLIDLLEAQCMRNAPKRIRLGSLEPSIITPDFVRRLAAIPNLCPHFHLSFQSGSDETLRRMNRRSTVREYYQSLDTIRATFQHPAITADLIVGFPGETQEEFQETLNFCENAELYQIHVFVFSPRQGTPAATMSHQIPRDMAQKRSQKVINLSALQALRFRSSYIGKTTEVLWEEYKKIDGTDYCLGHTSDYVKCALPAAEATPNTLTPIIIKQFLTDEIMLGDKTK
ncbi:MAG: tRNA (N(6)-L-threonylcarbamoyladenosine(37)-C(2))-methylthiotransferase MtaB [Lachnospiraceae bacterium]|nr:tRNA (N(6)-L-threonylcarbamoyladenosine(37)-C(2))-methylthiotransferase MtaB [Lachnospiraceae bacterium]